jgi:hypothetical protein
VQRRQYQHVLGDFGQIWQLKADIYCPTEVEKIRNKNGKPKIAMEARRAPEATALSYILLFLDNTP